jgi:hypothetical protein
MEACIHAIQLRPLQMAVAAVARAYARDAGANDLLSALCEAKDPATGAPALTPVELGGCVLHIAALCLPFTGLQRGICYDVR